jgi:two-component system cell cycle sensor histidine kinase/response regulator CckA
LNVLRLRDLPIRRKLTMIAVTAAGAAIFLACASFVAYELITFRAAMVRGLSTQAEIVARQSAAALVFEDPEDARATLDALRAEPRVVSAAIYTRDGSLFASYVRDGEGHAPAASRPPNGPVEGHAFEKGRLVLFRPIRMDEGVIGIVQIESDLSEMAARLQRYALIVLCVLLASLVVAHGTASRLQRVITVPVQQLAATAQAVSSRRDYSVRAVSDARDELGQLVETFNHMLDQIRDRDLALHASEEQYRLLFESNPHPMWVFDPGTRAFLAVNDAAVRVYAYSRDEFLAMGVDALLPAADASAADPGDLRETRADIASDGLWKHRRKDGSIIDVEVSTSETVFRGRPARFVLATDVSARKQLEDQLLQSQKMEAVGRLAGGVAHDFNNLLGVITGYSDLLGRSLSPQDPAQARLAQIRKAAERATGLTRQLLAFSRKEVIQPRVLDLNEVVGDMEKLLQRLIGEDVRLVTRLAGDLGRVRADRGQIDQVILNLAVNARDAMPEGGDLIIETSNEALDEAYAGSHADVAPGRYVMIAVSDTGHGMDVATISHIFEPFFTTKEQGKGTGLGLATVFGIARQSGGHINVYSEAGKGATFKLYLPRVNADVDLLESESSTAPAPRGNETILLVEDAEALGAMIQEILTGAGFSVLEFSDPQEALTRMAAHQGPLDLVLTDVVMPHMSGPELVRTVRETRPQAKALFMSGYTNEAIGRQGVLDPGTNFIQKPFTAEALLRAVRAAIDRHPG